MSVYEDEDDDKYAEYYADTAAHESDNLSASGGNEYTPLSNNEDDGTGTKDYNVLGNKSGTEQGESDNKQQLKGEYQAPASAKRKANGGEKFDTAFLKKHWKTIKSHAQIKPLLAKANTAVSSAVTGACVGLDYILWVLMAAGKPSVMIPTQRLNALFELVMIDDGIAGAFFGMSREQIDRMLDLPVVKQLGQKIVEIVRLLGASGGEQGKKLAPAPA